MIRRKIVKLIQTNQDEIDNYDLSSQQFYFTLHIPHETFNFQQYSDPFFKVPKILKRLEVFIIFPQRYRYLPLEFLFILPKGQMLYTQVLRHKFVLRFMALLEFLTSSY